MEERDTISAELKLVAPALHGISRQMPYALPEGYFELLPMQMLSKISRHAQPVVPEGYFDTLPAIMLKKVKSMEVNQELEEVAPLLNTISRDMPFSVPAGYFESLQPGIEAPEETPVVPMHAKRRPWMWAAAAIAIGIISLVALQYRNGPNNQPGMAEKTITDSAAIELAAQLKGIEDSSISSEITDGNVINDISAAILYLDTDNFETALRNLSDDEIRTQLVLQEVPLKKS